jgi:hypothetical protein
MHARLHVKDLMEPGVSFGGLVGLLMEGISAHSAWALRKQAPIQLLCPGAALAAHGRARH